ncbi:MAG: DUF4886 domain-containing protein [Clostridia bacterium]|nr:DUF4886 domain-containing protein [Clostridia bacterium]
MKKNLHSKLSAFIFILILSLSMLLVSCGEDGGSGGNQGSDKPTEKDPLACTACDSGKYERAETLSPTALTDGEATYTCSECGDSYTEVISKTKSVKLLFIGDASNIVELSYLDEILSSAGIENYLIATLNHNHNKGATVESQWTNIRSAKKTYTFAKNTNGETVYKYSQTIEAGITDEAWDFIAIGQSVPLGGSIASYANVSDVLSYISETATNPNMKLLWRMTWALRSDSANEAFAEFDGDQAAMYNSIVTAITSQIQSNSDVDGIVPVGTAVQSLRETSLGDTWTDDGILLGGTSGDGAAYAASLLWASEILGLDVTELKFAPEAESQRERSIYSIAKEAAQMASENKLETADIKVKSMKILMMGNSYGNDAMAYFEKILNDAGYINVVIGHMGESSMAINDHYHNIDDDPDNDYIYKSTGNTFSVHSKTVNGVRVELEADYKKIVANEDWDIITFYQGPNSMDTLTKESYYSELDNLCEAIRANMTNPNGKIVYYMPWVHGETNTAGYYAELAALTEKLFVGNKNIDGIIPAGTVIQNLRTSYLDTSASNGKAGDINRDWGHLNYGVGRYSVALTFYAYLTGGDINDISYIPTKDEISSRPFTEIEPNIDVIREAITNALENPFEITASKYTEKP